MKDYYSFWGKARPENLTGPAYHLLAYHSLDVAAVGRVLLQRDKQMRQRLLAKTRLDESVLLSLVPFFLSLHDLGKFAEGFQNLRPELFAALRGCASTKDYAVRHDSLGYLLWSRAVWLKGWEQGWLQIGDGTEDAYSWGDIFSTWLQAACGHHGEPPRSNIHGMSLSLQFDSHFNAEVKEAAVAYTKEVAGFLVRQGFSALAWRDDLDGLFPRASWLLSGLTILSDWIGSNSTFFPYHTETLALEEYWQRFALPQAEAAVTAFGVLPPPPSKTTGMARLFPNISEPSPLQDFSSSCELAQGAQLFILEDVTGSGKTEAALTLAHRLMTSGLAEGIFMALPTMATANAMFERVEQAYRRMYAGGEPPSLILSHSSRHLSPAFRESIGVLDKNGDRAYARGEDTASNSCNAWLADNRKKAFLAAIGVGTLDQALLAVLPSRHQSLRLLGLGRSVLIVDEVHAYDPYMHTLLRNLLKFHAAQGGCAILLSATLPQKTRQELVDGFTHGTGDVSLSLQVNEYPLVTHVRSTGGLEQPIASRNGTSRTVAVQIVHETASVEMLLQEAAAAGRCACWVRNTVADAVSAYERLSRDLGADSVMLFHARFALGDRLEIERKVLRLFGKGSSSEERVGKILIATQVVEQSLDLDFDFMVTDLAPIELIIQRAGRLHRHPRGERRQPTLAILCPPLIEEAKSTWYSEFFPQAAYVYPSHGQLWLAGNMLARKREFTVPGDARCLVEAVYGEEQGDKIPPELRKRDLDADGKARAEISLAQLNCLDLDAGYTTTLNQWLDDTVTPTRLGAPATTVRLARWDGGCLTPWFPADRYAWDLSQVSVNRARIAGASQHGRILEAEAERAMESMPDRCKWSVLVPLSSAEGGTWRGRAVDHRQRQVTAIYHSKTGLRVVREGETESSS